MALFEGNSNPPLFLALFPVFMMINLPSYLILNKGKWKPVSKFVYMINLTLQYLCDIR